MEKTLISSFIAFVSYLTFVSGGSLILPPEESNPYMPICTSYSGLCHLAYNVSEARGRIWHSHGQICRCPGEQRCPVEWSNTENSIIKVFKSQGKEMEVKVSYCHLNIPEEICRFDTPAVVLRGNGPFHFEIYEDFRCKCNRRLFANRSWRLGDYVYTEFNCGKPRCIMNSSDNTCMRMTYQQPQNNIMNEYICRCRRHEECVVDRQPNVDNPVVTQICRPFSETRRRN